MGRGPLTGPIRRFLFSLWGAFFVCAFILDLCAFAAPAKEEGLGGRESTVVLEGPYESGDISLSFSYGYQNVAMSGEYLPIELNIANESVHDIRGCLEIYIEDSRQDELIYEYELELPADSVRKLRSTISVPDDTESLEIRLVDEGGQRLIDIREEIRIHGDGSELLIGLLSNRPDSLSYLRGVSLADQSLSTRTVTLSPGSLPETREGLEQLSAIVISDFNMRRLSDETVSAIYEWVRNGGVLLIGTGDSADPLGGFADRIEGLEISEPQLSEVNMGMQYSTEGPDGATLSLMIREIFAPGGIQSLQSGNLGVLTNISAGSGVIGITAYSLCDISDFCLEQLGYVEELLEALFGSARLRQARTLRGEAGSGIDKLKGLVDIADGSRLPDMKVYLFFAMIYIAVCGPGLYVILRRKGLSIYYPFGVVICSFAGMLAMWLCSLGTRYDSAFADYASIRHISEGSVNETVFLKLSSPDRGEIELKLPSDDMAMPVLPAGDPEENELLPGRSIIRLSGYEEGSETGTAAEGETRDQGSISVASERAFSEAYFEIIKGDTSGLESGISIELNYFEDELSGEIVNDTPMRLSDVSLLMFGRIISVGDMEPGESRSLEGLETVYGPTGSAKLSSEYITGIDRMKESDEDYSLRLKETNLLAYYLEESLGYYYQGVRLVAFTEDSLGEDPLFADNDMEISGLTLIALSEEAEHQDGSRIYRSALSEEPRVINGNYDTASNTISGTASAVVEYKLGTDIIVSSVRFSSLSESFSGKADEEGNILIPFTGAMSIYNYTTGSYDLVDAGKTEFSAIEMRPYMSPENAFMVRFIPDENTEDGNVMFLPVPMVTGVSR